MRYSGVLDFGQPTCDNQIVGRVLLLAVFLGLSVSGCSRNQDEPLVIELIEGPTEVRVRDTVGFKCLVSQRQPGPLDFTWACSTGRLTWDWGYRVRWHAPETSGRSFLCVTAADSLGNTATETLRLLVTKRVVWPIIWDAAVKPYSFAHWMDSMWAGYVLSGRSGSDSTYPVFLLVMDDSEYQKWVSGEPAVYIVRRLCYKDGVFTDTLRSTGRFHVIVDNTQSPAETDFWVRISLTSP